MENSSLSRKGLLAVIAAIIIQLTLGIAYIWSVFQNGIAYGIFGGDNAAAALTFSLLLMAFTLGSVVGGKLAAKYTIRRVVFVGGIISATGFFAASFVTQEVSWLLWFTYGIMGGTGMGFAYSNTIACAQKWYPHKRGLVSGVIVAALGFGGVIFTPVIETLIGVFEVDSVTGSGELRSFMVLGGVFLIVCTACSYFMMDPPKGYLMDKVAASPTCPKAAKDVSPSQLLKRPLYYLVTITLLLACMSGLMMMAFAMPIAEAKGMAETAVIGVLAITLSNSLGRLFWGGLSDKLGRVNTLILLLAGTAVLALFVDAAQGNLLYVLIALIGFFYGGILGSYPPLTSDLFGAKNMAANYGFILLGFGVGAILSSQIAGHFRNIAEDDISLMFPAFIIASICAAIGALLMLCIKVSIGKKMKETK